MAAAISPGWRRGVRHPAGASASRCSGSHRRVPQRWSPTAAGPPGAAPAGWSGCAPPRSARPPDPPANRPRQSSGQGTGGAGAGAQRAGAGRGADLQGAVRRQEPERGGHRPAVARQEGRVISPPQNAKGPASWRGLFFAPKWQQISSRSDRHAGARWHPSRR